MNKITIDKGIFFNSYETKVFDVYKVSATFVSATLDNTSFGAGEAC
jgi:hypothetical protein